MPHTAESERLAGILSPAFGRAAFRVDRKKPLTFVCGGNNHNGISALRHQFLRWASTPPSRIVPVLAERAFPHQLIQRNIQTFETTLAATADCVLIFVESPGSFAETGMFAALKAVAKKTLVVNTRREATGRSFLNDGPIKLIRKKSRFDTAVDLGRRKVTRKDAQKIVEVILNTYPKYKKALVFDPQVKFKDLDPRLQLACVYVAVTLMYAGAASLVAAVLRVHFRAVEQEAVDQYLSVLTSIGLLQRSDEIYFNPNAQGLEGDELIPSTNFPIGDVRVKALDWQIMNNSQVATFLREERHVGI